MEIIDIDVKIAKYKKKIEDLESKKKKIINFVATWIGKSNKKSNKDYIREISRENSDVFFWDDTKKGHAVAGGYFVFIVNNKMETIMKIYKIRSVTGPENRLDEWANNGYYDNINYDTSTRKLLTIEKNCLKTINWREYADAVGYTSHLQCTQPIRKHEMLFVSSDLK